MVNNCILQSFIFAATLLGQSAAFSAVSTKADLPILKYFDIRGAAETCRVILAIGGEDYVDERYEIDPTTFNSPAFLSAKESGELKANLNRAPVLIASNGVTIGQSRAIERYLARKLKMMGNTPEEEAIIDSIAEHCRDVKDAAMRKGFSRFVKDKTDEEKAKARSEWFGEDMPAMLGKIEAYLEELGSKGGYSMGESPSYADVAIWALLRDCSPGDLNDTTKASKKCKILNEIADTVANHPGVSAWLEKRPQSMF